MGNSNEQNENTSRASAGSSVCDDAAIAMNGKQADNTTSKGNGGEGKFEPYMERLLRQTAVRR